MKEFLEIYQRIAPEVMKTIEERELLLKHISYSQPIGRRMLANACNMSERVVRSHVESMKDNGLLSFTQQGMELTEEGKLLLPELIRSLESFNKISELEESIRKALKLDRVIISGGLEIGVAGLKELGFHGAKYVHSILEEKQIIAVSGGSTMEAVVKALPLKKVHATIIPARGGIGEKVEYQANMIAAVLAEKTGGIYHMLHLPDGLSPESLKILVTMEPQIREIVELGKSASVLMFGIGQALYMAKQRHTEEAKYRALEHAKAVGEALGYYCTIDGKVVDTTENVGIALTDTAHIPYVIAVAGGKEKAAAIIGVMRACKRGTLIIDEGAALQIANLLNITK